MSNKQVRSVSFNKTNEKDALRQKFIGKKSFSKLIKKLLDEEMKRREFLPSAISQTATPQQGGGVEIKSNTGRVVPKITPKIQPTTPPPKMNNPMLGDVKR